MKRDEHELLAETGAGTPMGNLLRRYWIAALLSRELEAEGAPVRVRLLGEDLIAFRNGEGRVGLLGEHCSHRGASLYFGKNAEGGLRCWYHGWKYDLEGHCVDMPNEPPQTQFCDKVHHTAYPCVERSGVVWAYLGPPEKKPALPDLEWLTVPESHVFVSKRLQHCHWTQGMEGDLDTSHLTILHNDLLRQRAADPRNRSAAWAMKDPAPKIETAAIPAGLLMGARRQAEPDTYYWRVNQWLLPYYTNWPIPGDNAQAGHAWTPIDSEASWVFTFSWHPGRPLTAAEVAQMAKGTDIHAELVPGSFVTAQNKSNEYATPGAPTGIHPQARITRLQAQDIAMTEGMGPLYDRTKENLVGSDLVIAQVRHRLVVAAQQVAAGAEPPGLDPKDYRLRPLAMELPRTVESWREAVAERMAARPETYRASV